jgi:hypothetical protein
MKKCNSVRLAALSMVFALSGCAEMTAVSASGVGPTNPAFLPLVAATVVLAIAGANDSATPHHPPPTAKQLQAGGQQVGANEITGGITAGTPSAVNVGNGNPSIMWQNP